MFVCCRMVGMLSDTLVGRSGIPTKPRKYWHRKRNSPFIYIYLMSHSIVLFPLFVWYRITFLPCLGMFSPFEKLLGEWVQALGATISGIIWVGKCYLWLVNSFVFCLFVLIYFILWFWSKIWNFVNVSFYAKHTEKKYLVKFSLENKPF